MLATFSLHSVVNDAGAYAGLASLIGLALLVLLYFAQAREIRRLSNWIDEEEERRATAPASLAPLPRATVLAPGVPPPPPASGAVTTAVPGVRRVAVPATGAAAPATAGGAPLAPATAAASTIAGVAPVAAAPTTAQEGDAAPAPQPQPDAPAEETAPREPMIAPATAAAQGEAPNGVAEPPAAVAAVPLAGPPIPSAEPAAGPLAGVAEGESASLTAVSLRSADEVEEAAPAPLAPSTPAASRPRFPPPPGSRAQPVAGSASAMMAAGGPPAALDADRDPFVIEPTRRRPGARDPGGGGPKDPGGEDGPPRSPWPAIRLLALAVVIVAVLIFVVTQVFGGASTPPAPTGSTGSGTTTHHTATGTTPGKTKTRTPPPPPDTITVSVLNGTTVTHLASGAWAKLATHGFKEGAIADAPVQDHVRTIVGYVAGEHAAAAEVAGDLGVSTTDAKPVDSASLTAGSAGGSRPQVVVTLGSEYANSR